MGPGDYNQHLNNDIESEVNLTSSVMKKLTTYNEICTTKLFGPQLPSTMPVAKHPHPLGLEYILPVDSNDSFAVGVK